MPRKVIEIYVYQTLNQVCKEYVRDMVTHFTDYINKKIINRIRNGKIACTVEILVFRLQLNCLIDEQVVILG